MCQYRGARDATISGSCRDDKVINCAGSVPKGTCIALHRLVALTQFTQRQLFEGALGLEQLMTNTQRETYELRDGIMNLLSDDEVARVSTAETAKRLTDGDEYVDLKQLTQGVCRARGVSTPMGSIIPRKAVSEATWGKILMEVTQSSASGEYPIDPAPTPRNT